MTATAAAVSWAPLSTACFADPAVNPSYNYQYLDGLRNLKTASAHQRPLVRLWDGSMNFIGQLTQEISAEFEQVYCDTGAGSIVIRKDNWLSEQILYNRLPIQDLNITVDPWPTMRSWQTRWGGKITNVTAKRDSKGLHTVELAAVENREHVKHVLAQANPIFPPELQDPRMWVFPWNCRTALTISLWINLARQFEPFLAIPDNVLNPGAWLGTSISDINPLAWPIQPQYLNPYRDTSRFEVFAARWQDFHTCSQAMLEDAGCIWKSYTWLKGEDTTSPHPELASIGSEFGIPAGSDFMPTRSCIILACEDKSGVTGPLANFTTGFLDAIASTADDLTTDVIIPQYAENGTVYTLNNNGEGPLVSATPNQIANWFDLAPAPPTVVFRDGEYSGIVESNHMVNSTAAKSVATGGKSPGWVNDLITFGVKYALSQLSDVIEFAGMNAGGPWEGAWQDIGTPGLDEIYQDEFSDTVLAYERSSILARELFTGDMGFLEMFQQGTGTAYTISGVLSLRAGAWKSRPFTNFKTTIRNASPWIYNLDFALGDRVGYEMDQLIFVDKVAAAKFSWAMNTPVNYSISVGTDYHLIDPVSKAMMAIAGIWNLFGMAMGSQEMF